MSVHGGGEIAAVGDPNRGDLPSAVEHASLHFDADAQVSIRSPMFEWLTPEFRFGCGHAVAHLFMERPCGRVPSFSLSALVGAAPAA